MAEEGEQQQEAQDAPEPSVEPVLPPDTDENARPQTRGGDGVSRPAHLVGIDDETLAIRPQTDPGPGFRSSTGSRPRFAGVKKAWRPPSVNYPEVEPPDPAVLRRAMSPPNPTLPRRPVTRDSVSRGSRRGDSLRSSGSLAGRGMAGKTGELVGKNGARYVGELLAGRPSGQGQYWVPLGSAAQMRLQYDGSWEQGKKQGPGKFYYRTGEVYIGEFFDNERHGHGRLEYRGGDVYEGAWVRGRKRGLGTQHYANGDCFVGYWVSDRREGMGTFYYVGKGKKYDGEWVNDKPKCGQMTVMTPDEIEALRSEASTAVSQSQPRVLLPHLKISQPNKILHSQVVDVRRDRASAEGKAGRPLRQAQRSSGTLSDSQLERLKHAFVSLAGGDHSEVGIYPSQVRDVAVLAGLDPAGEEMAALCKELVESRRKADGLVHIDEFFKVVFHFRTPGAAGAAVGNPLSPLMGPPPGKIIDAFA